VDPRYGQLLFDELHDDGWRRFKQEAVAAQRHVRGVKPISLALHHCNSWLLMRPGHDSQQSTLE
jgi:hypothetical protein